jgi:ribonuclease P protein component
MLAAAQRVRHSADFADTVRTGRRAGRGAVVVHVNLPLEPPTEPAPPRAGFVVSKAVGGAVQRNLVRRRLRHLTRDRLAALPPGAALVVRALPAAASRSYGDLGADLDGALAAALDPSRRGRGR